VTASDVAGRIDASRAAQADWAALSWKERSRRLAAVERYIGKNADMLAESISLDNGKTRLDALATEVLPAAMALRYYRTKGRRFIASRRIPGGSILMFNKRSRLIYEPYGVVGIISPWNYPFAIPFAEVVMALLAGNGVLLKVASDTLDTGKNLERVFASAELPDGLFSYCELPGREAGPAFIDGGVDKLFFTGSTEVGRELMARAAPRLLPLVLELGGADAAIVRFDADLDRAASGVLWAGFSNAGQSCGGIQRVLVHQAVYAEFLEKLASRVGKLRVGDGMDWDCDMGPLCTPRQKETVRAQIQTCLESGARIHARSPGGDLDGSGAGMPALVLTGVTDDMAIMKDEIFGPVVAVIPVSGDEEALRIANESIYGLTGSVWSRDRRAAREVAARIHAGAVMVNDHLMSHGLAETPWGGFGDSGLGRTHGKAGLREMVRMKVVVDDILPFTAKNLWWHPYSKKVYDGMRAILDLQFAETFFGRLSALPRVVTLFLRYWDRS